MSETAYLPNVSIFFRRNAKGRQVLPDGAVGVPCQYRTAILGIYRSAGNVLYLALEDDYRRLQNRIFRWFGVESTPNLHFALDAKQIGAGLRRTISISKKE